MNTNHARSEGLAEPENSSPIAFSATLSGINAREYEALEDTAANSISMATTRAYQADWRQFVGWTDRRRLTALPAAPGVIAVYLNELARSRDSTGRYRYAVATVTRRLSAINQAHIAAGHPRPGDDLRLTRVMTGIRRSHGSLQRRMAPLLTDDVRQIVKTMHFSRWPEAIAAYRDATIVLLGFAGAFRRSELAGLAVGDVAFDRADGLHIRVNSSKTDQEGRGLIKAIPYGRASVTCGPCAFHRWLSLLNAAENGTRASVIACVDEDARDQHVCRGHNPGYSDDRRPLFRAVTKSGVIARTQLSDHPINSVVKVRAAGIGFDPTLFGGHSLRAGFVTEAFRRGQGSRTIRKQTGHQSDAVLDIYDRENAPMHNNAAQNLGL